MQITPRSNGKTQLQALALRPGRTLKRYLVGDGRHLTARQIATEAGIPVSLVYSRVGGDMAPERLLQPKMTAPGRNGDCFEHPPGTPNGKIALFFAIRLVMKYGTKRAPTVAQLRADYGVSRATAYRWRAAYLAGTGEAVEA